MRPIPRDVACVHPIRERDREASDDDVVIERCAICDEVWIEPRRRK